MTRNDALEALDRLHANAEYNGCLVDFRTVKQSLTAQPSPDVECVQKMHELELPDVEALREDVYAEVSRCCIGVISPSDAGYGAKLAFDYLASRGHLKTTGDDEKGVDLSGALSALESGDITIDVMHTYECGSRHNGGCICKAKDNEKHIETIRDALDACDKLQSGKLSIGGWETIRSALSDHLASTGRISEWRPISEAPRDGRMAIYYRLMGVKG